MKYLDFFEKLVEQYPNKIVIEAYGEKITYFDLDLKSSKIAYFLQERKIKEKNLIVGIFSNGKVENFITILACIKVGVPFINIDIKAPNEYIDALCKKLKVKLCLYSSEFEHLVLNKNIENKNIIELLKKIKENIFFKKEDKLEYYVATSGTTGTPKLVKKTEEALMNSFNQLNLSTPMIFNSIVQQYATLSFAFGLDQTLIMLIGKSKICINPNNNFIDFNSMCLDIEKNKAEVVFWAASIIKLLSRQSELFEKIPKCVKYIVAGGEPLIISADFIFELRNRGIMLLNNYGSTETGTIFFSPSEIQLQEIEQYNKVSIGEPLNGVLPVLLDEKMNEVEKGELYIGMDNFFNSYLDIDINEKIYILEKYPNKIFYKIGDILEKLNNKYYVIGRRDNCVNIRGYKIELENIENKIMELIKGNECCVISIENNYKENNLICYYNYEIEESKLKNELTKILPHYMIPISFIKVNEIIHSKNGKVNRVEMKKKYEKYLQEIGNNSYNEKELRIRLKKLVEKMLNIQLSENCYFLKFQELGLDSLGITDYICMVEKQENIKIEDEALINQRFNSIDTLVQYIRGKENE